MVSFWSILPVAQVDGIDLVADDDVGISMIEVISSPAGAPEVMDNVGARAQEVLGVLTDGAMDVAAVVQHDPNNYGSIDLTDVPVNSKDSSFDSAPTLWATYIWVSVVAQLKIMLSLDEGLRNYVTTGDGFMGNEQVDLGDRTETVTRLTFIFGSDAAQVSHKAKDRGAEHMTTMVLLWVNLQKDLIKSESYVLLSGLCNLNDKTPLFVRDFLESQLLGLRQTLHTMIIGVDITDRNGRIECTKYFRIEMLEEIKLYDTMLYRSINGTTSGFASKYLVHSNLSKLECNAIGRVAVDLLRIHNIPRAAVIDKLYRKSIFRGAFSSLVRWQTKQSVEFSPTQYEAFVTSRNTLKFHKTITEMKSLLTLMSIPVADMPTGLPLKAPNKGLHDGKILNPRHIPVPHLHSLGSLSTHFLEALLLVYYVLVDTHPSLHLSKEVGSNFSNHFVALSNGYGFGFTDFKKIKGKYSATVGSHAGNKIAIILFSNCEEIIPIQYRVALDGTDLPAVFGHVAACFCCLFKVLQQIFWMLHERNFAESLKNVGLLHLSLTLYMKIFLSIMGPYRAKPYDWTVVMAMRFFIDEAARLKLTPLRLMAEYGIETFHSLLLDLFHSGSNQTTSSSPKQSQATAMKSLVISRIMRMYFDARQQLFAKRVHESKVKRSKDNGRRNPMLLPFIQECNDYSKGIITQESDENNFGLLDEMAWTLLSQDNEKNESARALAEEFLQFTTENGINTNVTPSNWLDVMITPFKIMLSGKKVTSTATQNEWSSERETKFESAIQIIQESKRQKREKHTSNLDPIDAQVVEGQEQNNNVQNEALHIIDEIDGPHSDISYSYRLMALCALDESEDNDEEFSSDILAQLIQKTNEALANRCEKINLLIDSNAFAFGEASSISCSGPIFEQLFKRVKKGESGEIVFGLEFNNSQSVTLSLTYEDATQTPPKKEKEVVSTLMRNIKSFKIFGINKQPKDHEYEAVAVALKFYSNADGMETFLGNKKITKRCYNVGQGPDCRIVQSVEIVPAGHKIVGPRNAHEWRMCLRVNKSSKQQLQQTTDMLKILTGNLDPNQYPVSIRDKVIFEEMQLTQPALSKFKTDFIQNTSKNTSESILPPSYIIEGFNSEEEFTSSTVTQQGTTGIPMVDDAKTTRAICDSILKLQTVWMAATESEREILFKTNCYQCSQNVYSSCKGTFLCKNISSSSTSSSSTSSNNAKYNQPHTICGSNNILHIPIQESDRSVETEEEMM